jgi:hypothetical protein
VSNDLATELLDAPLVQPEQSSTIKPFTIWNPSQFRGWVEPAGNHLILPAYFSKGSPTTLIGQGGLGKTRLALWLAICQILGRLWCGLETVAEPIKWLFLGDENSIARWKEDLERMFSTLEKEEIDRVEGYLRLPALVELEDSNVWLGDPSTCTKLAATIEKEQPGAIVADPFGNFAPGDIAKPGDMRDAIRVLFGILRRSAPKAAWLLLHHARTGRLNIAQGIGWDAANFGLGGKALFSAARCQMNLMPGHADDDTKLVLHCAKANNCPRFETRGIIFNPDTFTYSVDPEFDLDAWLADVEGRSRSGQSLATVPDVVEAVRDGYVKTKPLVEHLMDAFAAEKRTVERLIAKAEKFEGIKRLSRGHYVLGRKAEKLLKPTSF